MTTLGRNHSIDRRPHRAPVPVSGGPATPPDRAGSLPPYRGWASATIGPRRAGGRLNFGYRPGPPRRTLDCAVGEHFLYAFERGSLALATGQDRPSFAAAIEKRSPIPTVLSIRSTSDNTPGPSAHCCVRRMEKSRSAESTGTYAVGSEREQPRQPRRRDCRSSMALRQVRSARPDRLFR
jgi:hypothetical protein